VTGRDAADSSSEGATRLVSRRGKAALLWAATGMLVFLVAHQGYLLLDGVFLGVGPIALVALTVFGATGASAYVLEGRR